MNSVIKKRSFLVLFLAVILFVGFSLSSVSFADAASYPKTTYEAESASRYNVTTNTNHPGYTGSGFVDGYGEVNDYVQFTISVSTTQDYILRFRYANYTYTTNIRAIYVDGNFISNAYFKDLGSWDVWGTTDVGTNLTAGTHTVKVLVASSSNGYINLDNLVVTSQQESVRALYMSNWNDKMAVWKASHLCNNDTTSTGGPRIDELRYSGNWTVDQINDYSGFFRDQTNSVKYNQIHNFNSEAYYDESGVLHTNYLEYNGSYLPGMEISKDYAMIPNEDYMVVRYSLTNTGSSSLNYSVMDMLHPDNVGTNTLSASYDSTRKAIIMNMSNASQPYIALGAFATPSYYQAANDADSNTSSSTCSPWYTFDSNGTLKNNSSVSAADISAAFQQNVTISAGSTQYVYFYVAMSSSLSGIQNACDEVRAQTGSYWFDSIASTYADWFDGAVIPSFTESGMTATYKRNLVMIKNCIRPGTSTADGAMPATTNAYNYNSKVWARDSAVTAISLDACGLTEEAGRYWNWLAARQASNGTFETCYWLWTNDDANFVEPEHDAIGFFLIGVYKHYLATGDSTFLSNIYDEVQRSANFIMNNMSTSGFGPADFSIFEESDKYGYYTYTQAGYAMGLKCAAKIASIQGNETLADSYSGAGSTILTAINRDTTSGGLWDNTNKYYQRLIYTNGAIGTQIESSTNILFALGAIDAGSSRAANHISKVETLASDTYGLPRYADDDFYAGSLWSPGGNEALENSPSWPQMTMWDSVYQTLAGNTTKAYAMLQWFVSRTATGYMVTGECISDVTEQPCVSTASEPITAASFILASLQYYGLNDMRVYAAESNAACYTSLNVTSGASNDWGQYTYVPYYVDPASDITTADSDTDIKKVYISNDANNIYIRINNVSGTLTSSTSIGDFQMSVYTEDFSDAAATKTNTTYGTNLKRNMAFQFTRKNTDSGYSKYTVSGNAWVYNKAITSVIAPQWDPGTGGMEIVIPRSEIGSPVNGDWGHITVMLQQISNNEYIDQDFYSFNYCLKGSSDAWLYGNFD